MKINSVLKLGVYITLMSCWLATSAQQNGTQIKGKVMDKQTDKGIPFAHVLIDGTQIGAITDLYGGFSISSDARINPKSLTVSCLGYKSIGVPLKNRDLSFLSIALEEDIVTLNEVVVRPEDPIELLREAYRRISENYDTSFHITSAYYKMTTDLADKNIQFKEAFIDEVKPRYTGFVDKGHHAHDSIRIHQVRTKSNELEDWKLESMMPSENSIYLVQHRDFVTEFLNYEGGFERFLSGYIFELDQIVKVSGRNTYRIGLSPKKRAKNATWIGNIFLDEQTKAFVKLDIVSSPKLFKKMTSSLGYLIQSKLYKVKYDQGEWKESINYRLEGDKWYFDEVNSSKHFLISSKKRNMDKVPVNFNLTYQKGEITHDSLYSDTTRFLPYTGIGYWEKKKFLTDRYDSVFWNDFDKQQGVFNNPSEYLTDDSSNGEIGEYAFTRLDTLQGALTPLRTSYDVGFYHLDVRLFPEKEIIRGSSTIKFNVVEQTDQIQVDLYAKMSVDSVHYRNTKLSFQREYNAIFIEFPDMLKVDNEEEIEVFFSGRPVDYDPRIPMYASFLWAEDQNENTWLQAICQGYGASGWWPNKDHLSDEPDSAAISVTVPSHLEVVANGKLVNKQAMNNGETRYDWEISYPINNYNLTLNVGKYGKISDQYINQSDTLELEYHVLEHQLESAKKRVEIVQPMLASYEKYFGPYPFTHDGFKLVSSLHPMEHQSCVSIDADYFDEPLELTEEAIKQGIRSGRLDYSIVLHETAHEWWGNSVSCTDNAELWIHEAFATYAESLFIEDKYGYELGQSYLSAMKSVVFNNDPIIGKMNVNHIHYEIQDMYTKGALMLNTLRHVIKNDSLWFDVLRGIQSHFKYQTTTTEQLVDYINTKTNKDLTAFFDQYLRYVDIPKLEVKFDKVGDGNYLAYRWRADVDSFEMPIGYKDSSEEIKYLYPSQEWKKMEYSSSPDDLEIMTDHFYIEVDLK
ncbi:MAG: M1 family aminopeptidase [Bacteroidota bacterium]